jgi:transposase-like protein/IS1 family transposase
MNCPHCQTECRKYGKNRNGSQRLRCDTCRKTFTDEATQPADGRKLDKAKAEMVLRLFLEGNSIRSTERLLGVHRDTVMALIVNVGTLCGDFLTDAIKGVPVEEIEADEIWGFVGCKERTKRELNRGEGKGDCYTYTAIERETKLLVAYHVGKRSSKDTVIFSHKLREATSGRFLISTDGYRPYPQALWEAFGNGIDYGQIIKTYGPVPESKGASRYSPPQVIDVRKVVQMGQPDLDRVSTSIAERQNLNIRMAIRRMTRLTNAHSKKWQNHEAAIALYFAYYNFCRVHSSLGKTPAMAAGLTDVKWTIQDLLRKLGM